MITTGTGPSSLGAFLEDAGCCQPGAAKQSQSSSFQEYVELAASSAETRAGPVAIETGSQQAASSESNSGTKTAQISQNGTQALTSQLSSTAPPYSTTETGAAAQDPSIGAVRNAMMAAGLDPDSVEMTYHEVEVWSPGGGWVNEMLRIETSDGKSLDFSARLSERSPEVTVCDVRHLIEGTMGGAALS